MARPTKPAKIVASHRSTEEKENRKKAEESMRGKSDKIKNVPRWLDDKAKTEYKKLYEEIKELDICSNLDINALAMIATCMARIKECEEVLKKEGIMVKTEKNGVIVTAEHPAIKTQLKYMDMLKKYMNEVNLFSPSGRAKLALAKLNNDKEKDDPLLRILSDDDDDVI